MASAIGAKLYFGTPDPLNDFDDHILPQALFQLSMTLTMVTMVLQIYRIICVLIIYRAAEQEKSYWRKLGEEHWNNDAPQGKNSGALKPPTLHSKKAKMNLQMMNWLERLVDPLVSTLRGKTSVSNIDLGRSTGASLKTDMMMEDDTSGGSAFGQPLTQPSIVATKSESDAQVINFLLRAKRDHECEMCSIIEEIDYSRFRYNLMSQGFHLLGTALGLYAQMCNYNQIIFYIFGTVHLCMSYGMTFQDSLGKLHLYGVLTRPDVCGYMKMKLVNESAVLIANLLFFFAFATLFGFYVAFDDYISTLFHDHLLFLF